MAHRKRQTQLWSWFFAVARCQDLVDWGEVVRLYKSHVSLDVFCTKFSNRVGERFLIYTKDYLRDGATTLLPVLMTSLWARQAKCPLDPLIQTSLGTNLLVQSLVTRQGLLPTPFSRKYTGVGCHSLSRGSSWLRDRAQDSHIANRFYII